MKQTEYLDWENIAKGKTGRIGGIKIFYCLSENENSGRRGNSNGMEQDAR